MTPILELRGIRGGYGTIDVLHGVNLTVEAGQVHVARTKWCRQDNNAWGV